MGVRKVDVESICLVIRTFLLALGIRQFLCGPENQEPEGQTVLKKESRLVGTSHFLLRPWVLPPGSHPSRFCCLGTRQLRERCLRSNPSSTSCHQHSTYKAQYITLCYGKDRLMSVTNPTSFQVERGSCRDRTDSRPTISSDRISGRSTFSVLMLSIEEGLYTSRSRKPVHRKYAFPSLPEIFSPPLLFPLGKTVTSLVDGVGETQGVMFSVFFIQILGMTSKDQGFYAPDTNISFIESSQQSYEVVLYHSLFQMRKLSHRNSERLTLLAG